MRNGGFYDAMTLRFYELAATGTAAPRSSVPHCAELNRIEYCVEVFRLQHMSVLQQGWKELAVFLLADSGSLLADQGG